MNNIEDKIKFWRELWVALINDFLERPNSLTLYTPHILIEDIILEIEENKLRNKENRKYFFNKLSNFIDKDYVIKKNLKTEFTLLRKYFNENKTNYLLTLSKKVDKSFKKGIYFSKTLQLTEKTLLEDTAINDDFIKKINYYTQGLIVELLRKSYALEDIKDFIKNIFSKYSCYNEKLVTKYPHNIDTSNSANIENIKNLINNLTNSERINKLSYYYNKKTEKVTYIFLIKGIKGQIEKKIFDVNFYSLSRKRYTKNEYDLEDLQKHTKGGKYLQAAVEVDYLLPKSSLKYAKSKIENTLDILSCYFSFGTEVSISETNYVIVNKHGSLLNATYKIETSPTSYDKSLNFNTINNNLDELNQFSFLNNPNINNNTITKIKNALHWYHKGEKSKNKADKMLNYWIAIENIFNTNGKLEEDIIKNKIETKPNLIKEIIASEQAVRFSNLYGLELYNHFSKKTQNIFEHSNIPQNLINQGKLNLKEGESFEFKEFIKVLPSLKGYEKSLFIHNKIDTTLKFYTEDEFKKSEILNHMNQVKVDILMIYRFRNFIVHNAHFDNTLLPYFVPKARTYCRDFLMKIIKNYKENSTLSDIIFDIIIEKDKFLHDLNNG